MLNVKIICVGSLKESYLREAVAEYSKRLSGFCSPEVIELKEAKIPDSPSVSQINAAIEDEGKRILVAIPPRATVVALCVEGKQLSSEQLAEYIEAASSMAGCLCFVIGGSHGLAEEVKRAAALRLSFSKLTFPHQLMRVILLEAVYRGFNIIKGTKYHK
ncbi:MAG: 23S rRNA (pseudouridine(1915)-N(3))-methyltransferase RlmH [Clostridia bacterium]|nr:23S rRNA (pseudouridine(1915)-N(3))-methyltransferase RlmH [Clostridia bacterium]